MVFSFWGDERRRTLTPGEKKYLLLKAKGKCEYCGDDITAKGVKEEIHHIVPWASRGSDNYHNLIVLCPNCHSKAEHISKEEFRLKIAYRLPKKAVVKKNTVSKAMPNKATAKKTTTKVAAPKKATAKKTMAKVATPRKATVRKTTAKVATPKKATAKKTTAKVATPRKATAKKTTAKVATPKKTTAKKITAKKK